MRTKRTLGVLLVIVLCLSIGLALVGCDNSKHLKDADYNAKLNAWKCWSNDISEAIPQTNVSNMVREFLDTPSTDGRAKKVLFLGYDGCRADRMQDILDTKTGEPIDGKDSAILETIGEDGALYFAYAGGNMCTSTRQPTITGCGWASLQTGVWGNKHKIKDNRDVKNPKYTTFVFDAANGKFANGHVYSGTYIASCTMHFATQYIDEINYLREHPKAGATMPAKKEHEEFIKEKSKWSESYYDDMVHDYVKAIMPNTSLPLSYVFVDNEKPDDYNGYYGDVNTKNAMIDAINKGTDIVFGIIEETDHVGHNIGFSHEAEECPEYNEAFARQEALGAEVVRAAKARASEKNEDWLIVMTTDHGGYNDYHGQQSFEERTIWLACNRPVDKKYFSLDYDGFKGKIRK